MLSARFLFLFWVAIMSADITSGAATGAYSFVWAMAGENVDYTDVVSVNPLELR